MLKFEEVLKIINGKNQRKVENPSGVYPIYGSGGVIGYSDEYICEPNTIVIGRKGNINKPIFVETRFWNVDTAFGLEPNREKLVPKYLYYFCIQYDFEKHNSTVTIPSLTKTNLLNVEMPVPSLEQQMQIVYTLDKLNNLIDIRKQQIEKLDLLIKSQFVEMFGDPVTNPMGWEIKSLKEICTKLNDGTHFSPNSYPVGKFKYVTAKNIKPDGFDFSNITYVNADVHNEIFARCNPEYGDVLYIKDGATTGIAMFNTLEEPFTLLSSVALLKPDRSMINGHYLRDALNNNNMYSNIRRDMGGAAITRLTIAKLNVIRMPLPPLDLQNKFAAFVQQVDKSKFALNKSLKKLEQCRDALMQEAFG